MFTSELQLTIVIDVIYIFIKHLLVIRIYYYSQYKFNFHLL